MTQMPDPKWVISMGACSSVGGPFNTYAVLQGVDKIVPNGRARSRARVRKTFFLLKLQDKNPSHAVPRTHHGGEFQVRSCDRRC